MTTDHRCLDDQGLPLDGEWTACCNAAVYGPCEDPGCGGMCEYKGDCVCPCHVEAASNAIEEWCRANPAGFEPVAPAAGFGAAPGSVTVSYLTAERDIVLIEPLSLSKYSQQHHETPLHYVHIYEECPSVKAALRRDGEVLRSRAPVDAFLNPPAARPCGVCLRWWHARGR